MEQPRRRWAQLSFALVQHMSTLPLLARGALLTFSLLTAVTAMATLARPFQQAPASDPFAEYGAIFPGQSVDPQTLIQDGFSCMVDYILAPSDVAEECIYTPLKGNFSAIDIMIWDRVVKRLDFILHPGAFSIGDLALLWGRPQIRKAGRWVSLNWPERRINGSSWSDNAQWSYFQAVMQVSFGV